jgi:hypothetical protein
VVTPAKTATDIPTVNVLHADQVAPVELVDHASTPVLRSRLTTYRDLDASHAIHGAPTAPVGGVSTTCVQVAPELAVHDAPPMPTATSDAAPFPAMAVRLAVLAFVAFRTTVDPLISMILLAPAPSLPTKNLTVELSA